MTKSKNSSFTTALVKSRLLPFHALIGALFLMILIGCGPDADEEEIILKKQQELIDQANANGQTQEFLRLSKELYDTAQNGHSEDFKAKAASSYAQALVITGQGETAKPLLFETLETAIKNNSDILKLEAYNGLGLCELFSTQNNFSAAEYFIKALRLVPDEDKATQMNILSNLTSVMGLNRDTTALKYAFQCRELARQQKNPVLETTACLNIGTQMGFRKKYDEQIKWVKEAAKVVPESMRPQVDYHFSDALVMQGKPDEAAPYIDRALAAIGKNENLQSHARPDAYYEKATVLSAQNKIQESMKWLDRLDSLMALGLGKHLEKSVCLLKSKNHEKSGNLKEALEYEKKYAKIIIDQADLNRTNILKAKEVALDVMQKENTIEEQQKRVVFHRRLLEAALLFIALLAILCHHIYRMYARQHRLMTIIVKRAEDQQQKLRQQKANADSRNAELFERIEQLVVTERLYESPDLSRYMLAERLGTNERYVTDAIKQFAGVGFPQYVSNARVKAAEQALHDPKNAHVSFGQLCTQFGFTSLPVFNTCFKRATGMTPSTYRAIALEKAG